jgi:deoxyribodipyrimidine photo-lyase
MWFRRDLRVADHPALSGAAAHGEVVCLWVVDPQILGRHHHRAPERLRFLRAGLIALDAELRRLGVPLVIRRGRPEDIVPQVAAEAGASRVHLTREISPLGRARDDRVATAVAAAGLELESFGGDLLAEPGDLAGSSGNGYLVFTPFSRAWGAIGVPPLLEAPALTGPTLPSESLDALGSGDPQIAAGPAAARAALVAFITSGRADRYGDARNALADDGTSRLSAYLRFGMTSPAQIGRALGLPGEISAGRHAFWRQICWRDFYHHHLRRHPEVSRMALRPAFRHIEWDNDLGDLGAWERGETGFPIVDAGMRQLAAQGWMHNRARMITASFLVKDLLIDWRRGESVFMRGLLDGDPANNNGGWQWTAGTGTDAAPYFRVFNPTLQAQKFDSAGAYVRRWVPELREVPDNRIHEPWRLTAEEQRAAGCRLGSDYPLPRVDHALRRREVLQRYRATGEAAG